MWAVQGEGIAARHAWVWLADGRMEEEDLGGGTLVNGHAIEGVWLWSKRYGCRWVR